VDVFSDALLAFFAKQLHNACFILQTKLFAGVGTETCSIFATTGCRASKGRYPSTSLDEKARTNFYAIVGWFISKKFARVNFFPALARGLTGKSFYPQNLHSARMNSLRCSRSFHA